jgi:hypothetical protein
MFFSMGVAVVGTGVAVGVGVTWAAGWEVHPATRIPINRTARTINSFFMHVFFVISVYKHIQFFSGLPVTTVPENLAELESSWNQGDQKGRSWSKTSMRYLSDQW